MIFCSNCGKQINDNAAFCPFCGANLTPGVAQQAPKKQRDLNMAQLIWSIVNLIFCCMPLGVAALILTIMAKDAADDEAEQKHLKNAKICNIIGTVIGGLSVVLGIFLIIFAVFLVDIRLLPSLGFIFI